MWLLMSQELRLRILLYLELHAQSGSSQYVDDQVLATKTGSSVREVQRDLDVLEELGLIESGNAFGSQSAIISPNGSLFLEGAMRAMSEPERRRIGFEPPGEPPH
jgi:Fe2+ or Zn2+ uptake regulation protein